MLTAPKVSLERLINFTFKLLIKQCGFKQVGFQKVKVNILDSIKVFIVYLFTVAAIQVVYFIGQ